MGWAVLLKERSMVSVALFNQKTRDFVVEEKPEG
ncbi:MAG: hypothetical protein QOD74_66, partial [Variibacter sp.]|nr:hypothetical protein [Variibacter sp.]